MDVVVDDVYYHERFSQNLLSWLCLRELGWQLHSGDTSYTVTPDGHKVELSIVGRLLMVPEAPADPQRACGARGRVVLTSVDDLVTLHAKLGHIGFDKMIRLVKGGATEDIGALDASQLTLDQARQKVMECESCAQGKGTRSPLGHGGLDHGTRKFEVLHADSFHIALGAGKGKEYGLIMKDPYMESLHTGTAASKDQLCRVVRNIINTMETQTGERLRRFRSDNGSEFMKYLLESYCKEKGIQMLPGPPYAKEMNGVAERGVRTVKENAITMCIHAGLGEDFIKYALAHFTYIWNRTHVAKATGMTPYEAIRGCKPNLKYIGVFGCDVWCHVPKELRYGSMLNAKMQPGIYLGHDDDRHAALVYMLHSGKLVHTRDVDYRDTSFRHAAAIKAGTVEKICAGGYTPPMAPAPLPDWTGSRVTFGNEVGNLKGANASSMAGDDLQESKDSEVPGPAKVAANGTPLWEVERILDKRGDGRRVEYFVKWAGYPDGESTWEPARGLRGCKDAVSLFEQQREHDGDGSVAAGDHQPAGGRLEAAAAADSDGDDDASSAAESKALVSMVMSAICRRHRC